MDHNEIIKLKNSLKVRALKLSDGTPIEGYLIGFPIFLYVLPVEAVEKAICTGQQQVDISVTAERILNHSITVIE